MTTQSPVFHSRQEGIGRRLLLIALILLVTLTAWDCVTPAGAASLTGGAQLAAVYDDILNARFDRARASLQAACPPAPREACLAVGVAITWWQIVLDLDSHALDKQLETDTAAAITAADAWTRREPQRAEAWFYLAGAYAPLVQLRVARGQRLAAARDGNRIRTALERARALDPNLHDAQFGIGLYHYYADVAPAAAKILRVLLLLPGGDRRQGLREMLEARDRGEDLVRLVVGYRQVPASGARPYAARSRPAKRNPDAPRRAALARAIVPVRARASRAARASYSRHV